MTSNSIRFRLGTIILLAAAASPVVGGEAPTADVPAKQANPAALLVEAEDLVNSASANRLRVLDVRRMDKYQAGHVSGAAWVNLDDLETALAPGQDPSIGAKKIGALGLDLETPVVVYDDGDGTDAARLWWMLRSSGVKSVRLLNGGWPAWLLEGAYQDGDEPQITPRSVKLQPIADRFVGKSQMFELLGSGRCQIVDVRSYPEFSGDVQTARRKGAIPSAKHLDCFQLTDRQSRFKPAEELIQVFRSAGIDPNQPVVIYGQTAEQPSVAAFALVLLEAKNVKVYSRGWQEWGNADDTPVALPAKKK